LAGLVFFAGCSTSHEFRSADLSSNKTYKKGKTSPQLKENEVLGLKQASEVTNADIERLLDEKRRLNLRACLKYPIFGISKESKE